MKFLLVALCLLSVASVRSQGLTTIDQDYPKAKSIAAAEDKLLFIDFYTDWCAPCKTLERLVFQNDSIRDILGEHIVMLRYNAERDTVFHLSKKHHIISYPTGILLTAKGEVLHRRYSFKGGDFASLSEDVLRFVDEGLALRDEGKFLNGYATEIDASQYPRFYVDFVNRTNTKVNAEEATAYFNSAKDRMAEPFFATLVYLGEHTDNALALNILGNRLAYNEAFGEVNADVAFYSVTQGIFDRALEEPTSDAYDKAIAFAREALDTGWTRTMVPGFERNFFKAQGRWDKVFERYATMKSSGGMDNGYVNYFCNDVYANCNDPEVLRKCAQWMNEVTHTEPSYEYYKTHAALLAKVGNKAEAVRVIQLAREQAEAEGVDSALVEKELSKLTEV